MMTDQTDVKANTVLLEGLRSAERSTVGRRVLVLVAIGFLSKNDDRWENWLQVRNAAAHENFGKDLGIFLLHIAQDIEEQHSEFENAFTGPLLLEVQRSGAGLRDLIIQAGAVVEVLVSSDYSKADFGRWFDQALDTTSEVGPLSGEITTSRALATLMVRLADVQNRANILDPSCGQGTLLAVANEVSQEASLYGEEIDEVAAALATVRLALLGAKKHIFTGDSLRSPDFWGVDRAEFDCILCDPPLGESTQRKFPASVEYSGHNDLRRLDSQFVALSASVLDLTGVAVILLPAGFLSRRGPEERLRNSLLSSDLVDGVILLPQGSSTWSSIALALLILRRRPAGPARKPIILVDGTDIKLSGRRPGARLQDEHIQELYARYSTGKGNQVKTLDPEDTDKSGILDPRRYFNREIHSLDLPEALERVASLENDAEQARVQMNGSLKKLGLS